MSPSHAAPPHSGKSTITKRSDALDELARGGPVRGAGLSGGSSEKSDSTGSGGGTVTRIGSTFFGASFGGRTLRRRGGTSARGTQIC